MALSNAERQRRYREARRGGAKDEARLNLFIGVSEHLALERLAAHHGVTLRKMIETLASKADTEVVDGLELDTPEWDAYFDGALRRNK